MYLFYEHIPFFNLYIYFNLNIYIYTYICIILFDVPFPRMVMVQWKITLLLKEIHLGDTSIFPRKAMMKTFERLSW